MAFKMKGFPMMNKPYNKNMDYKPQTQMTDEELAEKKILKILKLKNQDCLVI